LAGRSSYTRKAVEEHGYYFSIPPSIIRSPQKEALAKALPMNALLLESDSPALGPEKGIDNEPRNIKIAAQAIAQCKSIPIEDVVRKKTQKRDSCVGDLTRYLSFSLDDGD
jgi:TatD DNase family protein